MRIFRKWSKNIRADVPNKLNFQKLTLVYFENFAPVFKGIDDQV
jgi:hypothetical protein